MATAAHPLAADHGTGRSYALVQRQSDDVRWRRLGVAALLTMVLPVSLGAAGGLYVWEIYRAARPLEALRLLAPALLGLSLVLLSYAPRLTRFGQSLAVTAALGTCTAWFTASDLAFEQAFQGLLSFVGRRPLLVTLGLSLLAAGGDLRLPAGELRVGESTGRAARALLIAGSALVIIAYVLPQRGSPFVLLLGERIASEALHGGAQVAAGRVLFWTLGLWPLGLSIAACVSVARGWRPTVALGLAARYGLGALAVLLCIPLLAGDPRPQEALLQVRTAVLLLIAIAVGSHAIEALLRHLLDAPLPPVRPRSMLIRDVRLRQLLRARLRGESTAADDLLDEPGAAASHRWLRWLMGRRLGDVAEELERPVHELRRPAPEVARQMLAVLEARFEDVSGGDRHEVDAAEDREGDEEGGSPREAQEGPLWPASLGLWVATGHRRLPAVCGAALLLAVAALAWRGYRPEPNLRWTLGAATEPADQVFGTDLPRFVVALGRRAQLRSQARGTAEAEQRLREQADELIAASSRVDEELSRRVARLIEIADALDRTGQLWLDAVHDVNRRTRSLGLPYYVDGNAMQIASRRDGTAMRLFYVTTFRVEQIHRFAESDRSYAALHVRRLDRLNVAGSRLGTVRPDEPFALVLLDNIERSVEARLEALRDRDSCAITGGSWGGVLAGASAAQTIDTLCATALAAIALQQGVSLLDEEQGAATAALVALQTDATERHELQHQVDGPDFDVPSELYELVPGADERRLRSVAQELSAHLAELGTDDDLATAWRLADLSALLVRQRSGSVYRYAAAVIASRLLDRPVLNREGRVELDAVVQLWQRVADSKEGLADWVAPAAARTHEELFGTPIATLRAQPAASR